jgi:hypothetical protein
VQKLGGDGFIPSITLRIGTQGLGHRHTHPVVYLLVGQEGQELGNHGFIA